MSKERYNEAIQGRIDHLGKRLVLEGVNDDNVEIVRELAEYGFTYEDVINSWDTWVNALAETGQWDEQLRNLGLK